MLIFVLCPNPVERIDILSEQLLVIAKELKNSDHEKEFDPLIGHLEKESRNLKEIYNEFCWLEMKK